MSRSQNYKLNEEQVQKLYRLSCKTAKGLSRNVAKKHLNKTRPQIETLMLRIRDSLVEPNVDLTLVQLDVRDVDELVNACGVLRTVLDSPNVAEEKEEEEHQEDLILVKVDASPQDCIDTIRTRLQSISMNIRDDVKFHDREMHMWKRHSFRLKRIDHYIDVWQELQ